MELGDQTYDYQQMVGRTYWEHGLLGSGDHVVLEDGEVRQELEAHTIESELRWAPSDSQINEALNNRKCKKETIKQTHRIYGGGGSSIIVRKMYVVMLDTIAIDGDECRVLNILGTHTLTNGVNIANVRVINLRARVVENVYVVPPDVTVPGFRNVGLGVMVHDEKSCAVSSPRIICVALEDGAYIKNPLRRFGRRIVRKLCCIPRSTAMVRVDRSLYSYLYSERLGTVSSLTSEATYRLIQSSAIKRSISEKTRTSQLTENTLKTTCIYFITNAGRTTFFEAIGERDIVKKSSVPEIFEKEACVLPVQGGWMAMEDECVSVPVTDNCMLNLIRSEGATYENGTLTFNTEYTGEDQVFMYGPAPASAVVYYNTKSTRIQQHALYRMTNSRPDELSYRINSDLMCYFQLADPQHKLSKSVKRYSYHFGAFDKWCFSYKDIPDLLRRLPARQKRHMQFVRHIMRDYVRWWTEQMDPVEIQFCNAIAQPFQMAIVADEPHIKRDERLLHLNEMTIKPWLFDPSRRLAYVDGKVKMEAGKFNKLPRQFVSLGPKNTLEWLRCPEVAKTAMANTFVTGNTEITFVKTPTQDIMDDFATEISNVLDPGYEKTIIKFHSDDSYFTTQVRIGGVLTRICVCVDISKCDLSHNPALFVWLADILEHAGFDPERIESLILQCKKNLLIKHPNKKVNEFAEFKLNNVVLFSGSVLTTLINNLASLLLLVTINTALWRDDHASVEEVRKCIIDAGKFAGYQITIDSLVLPVKNTDLAHITFLKHFPVESASGRWVAYKDMATLIRSAGFSMEECKQEEREKEILNGWNMSHRNRLIDLLFETRGLANNNPNAAFSHSDAFEERYGATESTLLEGLNLLYSCKGPTLVAHPGLDSILRVGYSLPRYGELEPREAEHPLHLPP